MEHKPPIELQAIADIRFPETPAAMSRDERLERWIGLLEANPERRLQSLHEIEHLPPAFRREYRAGNSPLTVAYEDPVLRSAGLTSDRVADSTEFFGLSDRQMHQAFCSCHVGARLTAGEAAGRLRHVLRLEAVGRTFGSVLWPRIRRIFRVA